MGSRYHDCGWCARWKELLEAFHEGRQEEAVQEARRICAVRDTKQAAPALFCIMGVHVRAAMRAAGYLVEL